MREAADNALYCAWRVLRMQVSVKHAPCKGNNEHMWTYIHIYSCVGIRPKVCRPRRVRSFRPAISILHAISWLCSAFAEPCIMITNRPRSIKCERWPETGSHRRLHTHMCDWGMWIRKTENRRGRGGAHTHTHHVHHIAHARICANEVRNVYNNCVVLCVSPRGTM